jgi:serine/threonine-protein kinase
MGNPAFLLVREDEKEGTVMKKTRTILSWGLCCVVGVCLASSVYAQEKAVIRLRSEPLTVSQKEHRKAFGVDEKGRPQTYIDNEFEDQGDVVVDHATGLMWQRSGSERVVYKDAHAYIDQLNQEQFAGYADWRLPTVEELMSLILGPTPSPTSLMNINPIFDETQTWCWSADRRSPLSAWYVLFDYGNVHQHSLGFSYYVRAVRSLED